MLKVQHYCKLFSLIIPKRKYIDCYLAKTCNTSFPYKNERLPTRWREIWNITRSPSSSQVGRNYYYYIWNLPQYWVTADKEILKARLTTSFKMATNRWVKRKWVRNQLYERTDHLYLSGRDETFSVRFVGGTPGEEAGFNKDDPADEHWFCFNRGELTVLHILQKISWKRVLSVV